MVTRPSQDAKDEQDLERFGYLQQLQRSMGGFSSFAISFSLISITTGIFGNFGHGINQFGPAVIFSWIVAAVGQLLVALMVAELATRFPISGYGYQWSSRIVNAHFGFFVGWCLLLQFLIGFPAICSTLGEYMCAYSDLKPEYGPWVTIGVVSVIAILQLVGIRVVSFINDAGVIAEIAGCAALTFGLLALWFWAPSANVSILFNSTNAATGQPALFSAFASSLLLGAWCITGFEGAADMAEETHQPRTTIPRAVVNSEISSGIGGLLMLIAFMLSISDLPAIQSAANPLMAILESKLSPNIMRLVMLVVYISIFACGVASMAAATRLLFALARDNMLPASTFLRRIDPGTQAPREAIIVVWAVSCIVIPLLQQVKALSSVATVAAYLGYAGIVISGLVVSIRPAQSAMEPSFNLGRWRWPVGLAALVWLVTAILALSLTDITYVTAKTTGVAVFCGIVIYFVLIRRRLQQGIAGPPLGPINTAQNEETHENTR